MIIASRAGVHKRYQHACSGFYFTRNYVLAICFKHSYKIAGQYFKNIFFTVPLPKSALVIFGKSSTPFNSSGKHSMPSIAAPKPTSNVSFHHKK